MRNSANPTPGYKRTDTRPSDAEAAPETASPKAGKPASGRRRILGSCGMLLYAFGLLSAFFFILWLWPKEAVGFSWVMILVGVGGVGLSILRKDLALLKQGKYSRGMALAKIVLDIAEVGCVAAAALLLAGESARVVGRFVGGVVEPAAPGLGAPAGLFIGLLAAVLVGLGIGFLLRLVWDWVSEIILGLAKKPV